LFAEQWDDCFDGFVGGGGFVGFILWDIMGILVGITGIK
jgi:hypothetical protein